MSKVEEILDLLEFKVGSQERLDVEWDLYKVLQEELLALDVDSPEYVEVRREIHELLMRRFLAPGGGPVDPSYEASLIAEAKAAMRRKAEATRGAHADAARSSSEWRSIEIADDAGRADEDDDDLDIPIEAIAQMPKYEVMARARSTKSAAAGAPEQGLRYAKVGEIWINGTLFELFDDEDEMRFLLAPALELATIELLDVKYGLQPVDGGKFTEIVGLEIGDLDDVRNRYGIKENSAHAC